MNIDKHSFDVMLKALERVSAHLWNIRPADLEPSALMENVDIAIQVAKAQLAAIDKARTIK